MDLKFIYSPFSVNLISYVVGSDIKIQFACSDIEVFHLNKSCGDNPLYTVLGTIVEPPKQIKPPDLSDHKFSFLDHEEYLWKIDVFPEIKLTIKCLSFSWIIHKIADGDLGGV